MSEEKFYRIKEICESYQLSTSFLEELLKHELILLTAEEPEPLVGEDQIPEIRRIRRLHDSLEINYAGIEMILEMRMKILQLQEENNHLKHRVRELERKTEKDFESYLKKKGLINDID